MALPEFLDRVRIGASFLSPDVWADSTDQSAGRFLSDAHRLADIWLTPAIVRGYSEADFVALPPEKRALLRDAVAGFRNVTALVKPTQPTHEQVGEALGYFLTILGVVRHYIATKDALAVRHAVWDALAPYRDWIASFDYKLDWDSTGAPVVWVWLILNDDVDVTARDVQLRLFEARSAIRERFAAVGIERHLYASVWKRREVAPAVLGGAVA